MAAHHPAVEAVLDGLERDVSQALSLPVGVLIHVEVEVQAALPSQCEDAVQQRIPVALARGQVVVRGPPVLCMPPASSDTPERADALDVQFSHGWRSQITRGKMKMSDVLQHLAQHGTARLPG